MMVSVATATEIPEAPPLTGGPIIGTSAVPISKGNFLIEPIWKLSFSGGLFSPSWRRVSSETEFTALAMPVKFKYGLAQDLEVRMIIPYVQNWARMSDSGEAGSAAFGGLGDLELSLKYLLWKETGRRPNVSIQGEIDFPTGHHRHLLPQNLGTDKLGSGAYAFLLALNLNKYLPPLVLYANLRYRMFTTATVADATVRARDRAEILLAAEYPFSKRWVALLEVYSNWEAGTILGPRSNQPPAALLGFSPGIEYLPHPRLAFELGVAIDLAGKNTMFNYTPILTVSFIF